MEQNNNKKITLEDLAEIFQKGFARMDERFDQMDKSFDEINKNFKTY